MATYKEIRDFVKRKYGYMPKPCWIADAKEKTGLKVRRAHNHQGANRLHPCPPDKLTDLTDALRYFKMIG